MRYGVGEIGRRESDARVAAHVFGLRGPVRSAGEEAIALDADPDDVVARRTIRSQGGEVHVVGRLQEFSKSSGIGIATSVRGSMPLWSPLVALRYAAADQSP
jgi:hypothetical protein